MKRIYVLFVVALSGLFFAGCAQNDEMLPEENKTWVKATVEAPATRLSVDMSELSPAWVFNDGIRLETTSNGWQNYTLKSGQGTKIGLFEGTGTPKVGSCAIYPSSHAGNGKYTFPTQYEFRPLNYDGNAEIGDPISEIPMVGKIRGEDDIKFYHVGGAIALKFNEITASEHRLVVTVEGGPVTGEATVDAANPDAALVPTSSTGQVITMYINKTMRYTLRNQTILVPVPAGTYTKVSIELGVKDGLQYLPIVQKSRTKEITITKGGIFSFAQLTTNYENVDHQLRKHFPIGGNLDPSYDETKMILCWVNTASDIAYMDADKGGHEPVALSSAYYHEVIDDGDPYTTDIYYQYVRLNEEMVNSGFYQLKRFRSNSDGYYYWDMKQSRGNQVIARLKCADPSSSTLADGTPNLYYYRYTLDIQSDYNNWSPVGYFMNVDMEILYKAYKNRTITGGNSYIYVNGRRVSYRGEYLTTYSLIKALFEDDDYTMEDEDGHEMWRKPYFEEVTLPGGAKDYVLQTPTLDNGFFLYGSLITYLKASTATITVTEQTGSVAPDTYPVGEFVHTSFMLLYAVAEEGDPTD